MVSSADRRVPWTASTTSCSATAKRSSTGSRALRARSQATPARRGTPHRNRLVPHLGGVERAFAMAMTATERIVAVGERDEKLVVVRFDDFGNLDKNAFAAPNGWIAPDLGAGQLGGHGGGHRSGRRRGRRRPRDGRRPRPRPFAPHARGSAGLVVERARHAGREPSGRSERRRPRAAAERPRAARRRQGRGRLEAGLALALRRARPMRRSGPGASSCCCSTGASPWRATAWGRSSCASSRTGRPTRRSAEQASSRFSSATKGSCSR